MKKLWKKLLAVTTAVMMAITLLPAMANAETTQKSQIFDKNEATLEIAKTDSKGTSLPGAEFKIYRVATVATTGTQVSYNVEESFKDAAVNNEDLQKLGTLAPSALESLAQKLAKYASVNQIKEAGLYTSGQSGKFTVDKNHFGIYLVVETTAPAGYNLGAPFFVDLPRTSDDGSTWVYDVVAAPKNGSNTLVKKIMINGEEKDATSVKRGDSVNYKVTGTLPYLTEEELAQKTITLTVEDTLSNGLVFNTTDTTKNNLVFNINGSEADKTKYSVSYKESKFIITITDNNYIKNNNGKSIELTYIATVSDSLSYKNAGLNNTIIKVNNEQKSKSDQPEVYTYGIKVVKKLGDKVAGQNEVEFGLYTDSEGKNPVMKDDKAMTGKTDDKGEILFNGLTAADTKNGTTYYLKELKTKDGYTLLSKTIEVKLIPVLANGQPTGSVTCTVDGAEPQENTIRLATATVTNNEGFNLPSTGGMGTYIFTIAGLVIMAGAAFLLIASKKRRA